MRSQRESKAVAIAGRLAANGARFGSRGAAALAESRLLNEGSAPTYR